MLGKIVFLISEIRRVARLGIWDNLRAQVATMLQKSKVNTLTDNLVLFCFTSIHMCRTQRNVFPLLRMPWTRLQGLARSIKRVEFPLSNLFFS